MDVPAPSTGVAALQDMPAPAGWPADRWNDFIADAWSFRRTWGKRATDLGWSPLDLFAIDPGHPWHAHHVWGAVLFVNGRKVVEVTEDTIFVETGRERIDPHTGEVTNDRLRISKRKPCSHARLVWDI